MDLSQCTGGSRLLYVSQSKSTGVVLRRQKEKMKWKSGMKVSVTRRSPLPSLKEMTPPFKSLCPAPLSSQRKQSANWQTESEVIRKRLTIEWFFFLSCVQFLTWSAAYQSQSFLLHTMHPRAHSSMLLLNDFILLRIFWTRCLLSRKPEKSFVLYM